jgi:diguanylate cyclase (GGDEF)-like protein
MGEEAQRDLALIDDLTGISNRRGFLLFADKLIKLSNRTRRGLILIYADLNDLKGINDRFGHTEGDKVLICVSKTLNETFRSSDVIGRVGGDEFAVLAIEAKPESLDMLRRRLKKNLNAAGNKLDPKHQLLLSIGMVYYNPEVACSVEELLGKADVLMYAEKRLSQKGSLD